MMRVRYVPPLADQIRACVKKTMADPALSLERGDIVTIFVRSSQCFVENIDPETYKSTGVPQQFLRTKEVLKVLPRYQWIAEPTIIEVNQMGY